MTIIDFLGKSIYRVRSKKLSVALRAMFQEMVQGSIRRFGKNLYNYGDNVFDYDWDVLIVLDTCRYDVLAEVSEDYYFLKRYDPESNYINSVASTSSEWLEKTFVKNNKKELVNNTVYISGNPHTNIVVENDSVESSVYEVWVDEWDEEMGTVPPRPITDRAITVAREQSPDRMIIHYMQPHQPYRQLISKHPSWFSFTNPNNKSNDMNKYIFERLRDGEIEFDEMWRAYKDNLRWVLDDVELLLKNMNGERVIITADHGEAFGEKFCYSHQPYIPIKELKRVPWLITESEDTYSYEPTLTESKQNGVSNAEVESRLRDLGYL